MTNNKKRNSYKIVTILIVSLLLSMFSNVLAADNTQLYQVPYIATANIDTPGSEVGSFSEDSDTISTVYVSTPVDNPNIYYTVYNANGRDHILVVCTDDLEISSIYYRVCIVYRTISTGRERFSTYNGAVNLNSTKDGYRYSDYSSLNVIYENVSCSYYTNFDDAFDSIVNYVEPSTAYSLNYSLPAGNAIMLELGQGSNPYTISTTSINPGPFDGTGLDGKQWGFYNTLPSTIEYPLSGASDIAFRGYGGQSVFGQYMTYSISGDFVLENHTEQYLIIVNPLWAYTSDGNITNSRIDISIDKVTNFKVYPLGTQLVNGGWTSQNEGEYLDGNYDVGTNTWYTTDEDGNVVESQVGGYNYVDYGPQTVTQWLENIAHQIGGFFTGAIGAITTLVSAIGNIATELHGLYVWLPPAVQGILTSALILAITIGVIKVFI